MRPNQSGIAYCAVPRWQFFQKTAEKGERMSGNKMLCPDCGIEMNHHAMKIDYANGLDEEIVADPDFGGVLQEAHTCPGCGMTELRKAQ
jgi:predicted RNA-binding Zn-ribbon protein involved in translation (DUF1610 family)